MAAFCNPQRTHLPVGSTCRFCISMPPGSGRPLICENILDPAQIMHAFELIEWLYLHVSPSIGLDDVLRSHCVFLRAEVQRIVGLLLCPQHGSQPNAVETLTDHYFEAMRSVATTELSNAQSLHKKMTDLYKARINNEYSAKGVNASAKSSFNPANVPRPPHRNPYSHVDPQQSYTKNYAHFKPPYNQPQSAYEHKRRRTNQPHVPDGHAFSAGVPNPATRPWSNVFQSYRTFWLNVENSSAKFDAGVNIDQQIIFPVHTGNASEMTEQAVNDFLREALRSHISGTHAADKLLFLKKERLRWHPDKIDQRFNGLLGVEKVKELAGVIIQQINSFADAEKGGHGK
ncbi:hypothetical protein MBLNU457_4131t2 [Dothideomycetes sp. NU457]